MTSHDQETPLEVREAAVREEVEKEIREQGQNWTSYINNFHLRLTDEEGSSRWNYDHLGLMDKKPDEASPGSATSYSAKRQNETFRDFFKTIDEVRAQIDPDGNILQLMADAREAKEIFNKHAAKKDIDIDEFKQDLESLKDKLRKLNQALIPLYIRLRALGYGHKELTE
jgi:hypothetical protein